MEGKYSVEVVEMICAEEADGNAQVTAPVDVAEEEEAPSYSAPRKRKVRKRSRRGVMQTNAATNWLLVGILFILFMFMVFKCD